MTDDKTDDKTDEKTDEKTEDTGGQAMPDTQALARAFQTRPVLPHSPCPEDATLYAAATGTLSTGETAEVVDHLTDCAACTQVWQLAIGLNADESTASAANVVPFERAGGASGSRSSTLFGRGPALAAAAALLFGVALMVVNVGVDGPAETERFRGGPVLDGASSQPVFEQTPDMLRFQWILPPTQPGDPTAASPEAFTLILYNDALKIVHRETSETGAFDLDRATVPKLTDPFFWQIEVTLSNGETLRSQSVTSKLGE